MPALSFNKKCHHNINVVTALFNNIYASNLFLVLFANQQRASITGSSKHSGNKKRKSSDFLKK